LIAAGAYVVYYWAIALLGPGGLGGVSQPIEAGSRLSSLAQTWLASEIGKTVTAGLALGLVALFVWVMAVRFISSRRLPDRSTTIDQDDPPGPPGEREG
jgi:hypothetical protein